MFAKVKGPGLLARLLARPRDRDRMQPLYLAIVAAGRDPFWYRDGQVPDTVQGRFDMIAAIMALVLLRYEGEPGDAARADSVFLTELFVEDMDESLHQIGVGDYAVGKHIGRMMSALGGRLSAFRADDADVAAAVRRNIFHEAPPSEAAVTAVAGRLARLQEGLRTASLAQLGEGTLPR